jgi:hypothetical protein
MREQKNKLEAASSLMVKMEKADAPWRFGAHPLAGQVFYVLDKDLSAVLKEHRDAIWGDLLENGRPPSESSRKIDIREILNGPDGPRKYPVALICTAESLARMTPGTNVSYARAIDTLRIQAVKFFVIDAEGKAKIEGLQPGVYYICGLGEINHKSGVWNVRVELKPGKNSLKLSGENITGRQK